MLSFRYAQFLRHILPITILLHRSYRPSSVCALKEFCNEKERNLTTHNVEHCCKRMNAFKREKKISHDGPDAEFSHAYRLTETDLSCI